MQEEINPLWKITLLQNNLHTFQNIWQLPADWLDEINQRGQGWSGVSALPLRLPSGEQHTVYVKRQQNYVRRYRPSTPVLEWEFNNIQRMQHLNIPTLTPIYFGKQKAQEGLQAILMTAALTGYQSLHDWLIDWQEHGWPSHKQQKAIIHVIAKAIKQLHKLGVIHGCLYPKHIFLSLEEEVPRVRLIDLEKCRYWPLQKHRTVRDLSSLVRYANGFSLTQQMRFFLDYLNQPTIDQPARRLIQRITKRLQRKGRA
jgi:hypothetical protein